eukprot:XP_019927922.1 PREDICTED: uncharacterized protein LOC109620283 [Crassostrea gigas]
MAQQEAAQQEDISQGPDIGSEYDGPGFRGRLVNFDTLGKSNPDEDVFNVLHWDVKLNASSAYIPNMQRTYSKLARGRSGKTFIGVRAFFPDIDANSFASVRPRNTIGFYNISTGLPVQDEGRGVLSNVSAIKQAFIRVAGRNYPHRLMVDVLRNTGEKLRFDFGYLKFAGWKELKWNNPRYQADFRDRITIITPLYPRLIPSVKFDNLIVFRSYDQDPGNFIGYVDYIDIQYDKAYADTELDEKLNDFRRLERIEKLKMNIPVDAPAAPAAPANNNQNINAQPAAQ